MLPSPSGILYSLLRRIDSVSFSDLSAVTFLRRGADEQIIIKVIVWSVLSRLLVTSAVECRRQINISSPNSVCQLLIST